MQVHSFWAINIVKHSILCGWHFSFFQQIATEANWGKHTSAQWLNDMSRAKYLSNMVADFNIARLQTPTCLLRQMNRWELCKFCCKTVAARCPWAGPEWPFTWSAVAVPQQVVSTAMEYDAGPAHTTDFSDKWRDLTLQSRLHWQVKGPHFTIYRTWNVLQGNSTFSCHDAVYVTLHRKAQPFLALAGKQALVLCSARLQENLGARITKRQSTSNLFSQQHLSHTIIMYITYSNNKNIHKHTQKRSPKHTQLNPRIKYSKTEHIIIFN